MSKVATFLNSLPELFLIVSREGKYVDYYGGNDKHKYNDVEQLRGKGFADFFSGDTLDSLLNSVGLCLDEQVEVKTVYVIPVAGSLQNQYYQATLTPLHDADFQYPGCVLLSTTNITLSRTAQERVYDAVTTDPFVPVNRIFNRKAQPQISKEFFQYHDNPKMFTVEFKDCDLMQSVISELKALDVEATVLTMMQKNFAATDHQISRMGFGRYMVDIDATEPTIRSTIASINKSLELTIVSTTNGHISLPIALKLLIL